MIKKIFYLLYTFYKKMVSPFLGNNCRFYPSCSSYAMESVQKHGVFRGVFLGIKRILKCHPWHPGGHDPVPDIFKVELKWKQND